MAAEQPPLSGQEQASGSTPSVSPKPLLRMRPDGRVEIRSVGVRRDPLRDLFHFLRTVSWPGLIGTITIAYLLGNLVFAVLFTLGGDCIANARHGSFSDAFFFSVQTMATIGYGAMSPGTLYAHILVTIESVIGLLLTATVTGVIFTKFASPSPRVLFSKVAVIGPYEDVPTLMFRMANERTSHMIVEATVHVTFSRDETTTHGERVRRLYDLPLRRTTSPLFALSWTVYHPVDAASPLSGATVESLRAGNASIIITMTGIDDTLAQTIHARFSYGAEEIVFNARFQDTIVVEPDGQRYVDYRKFHDVKTL